MRPLRPDELNSETEKRKRQLYDDIILPKLGDAMTQVEKPPPSDYVPYADGELDPAPIHDLDEDPVENDGTAVFEKPITDHLIHA